MKIPLIIASLVIPVLACGQSATTCPMLAQHQETTADPHAAGVDARGDHAMGFLHNKSTHHFRLHSDGGAIEVDANDKEDVTTRDQIQMHLSYIAQMFTEGNFQVPMFIHDNVPPGVPVMESKRGAISYTFEQTPNGGRVHVITADKDALQAVHDFLAFQIDDHRTGDSKTIEPLP